MDEQTKLTHENLLIGLALCKTADHAQVRLALTAAARKIGVATFQTALPDAKLIRARLEHFAWPREDDWSNPTAAARQIDFPAAAVNQGFICLDRQLGQVIAEGAGAGQMNK